MALSAGATLRTGRLRTTALIGPALRSTALRPGSLRRTIALLLCRLSALLDLGTAAAAVLPRARWTIAPAARRALAVFAWSLIRAAFGTLWTPRPFRAGPDHGQRHPAALLIDLHHPDVYDIAHCHDFVWIADEAVRESADMHQSAVVHADIDEAAKIDDVEHRAGQFHSGREVF